MRRYHSPSDYVNAARSQETSVEELRILAMSEYNFVRTEVARNTKTEPTVIQSLVPVSLHNDPDYAIAIAIIENINTPEAAIETIVKAVNLVAHFEPRNFYQRQILIKLFTTPHIKIKHITSVLSQANISKSLRVQLTQLTTRQDVLEHLLTDKSETVRKKAIKRLQDIKQSNI